MTLRTRSVNCFAGPHLLRTRLLILTGFAVFFVAHRGAAQDYPGNPTPNQLLAYCETEWNQSTNNGYNDISGWNFAGPFLSATTEQLKSSTWVADRVARFSLPNLRPFADCLVRGVLAGRNHSFRTPSMTVRTRIDDNTMGRQDAATTTNQPRESWGGEWVGSRNGYVMKVEMTAAGLHLSVGQVYSRDVQRESSTRFTYSDRPCAPECYETILTFLTENTFSLETTNLQRVITDRETYTRRSASPVAPAPPRVNPTPNPAPRPAPVPAPPSPPKIEDEPAEPEVGALVTDALDEVLKSPAPPTDPKKPKRPPPKLPQIVLRAHTGNKCVTLTARNPVYIYPPGEGDAISIEWVLKNNCNRGQIVLVERGWNNYLRSGPMVFFYGGGFIEGPEITPWGNQPWPTGLGFEPHSVADNYHMLEPFKELIQTETMGNPTGTDTLDLFIGSCDKYGSDGDFQRMFMAAYHMSEDPRVACVKAWTPPPWKK